MPREQAGSGEAGGAGDDRGPRQDAGRLNDWQRIDTEKPDRDRAMKAWDATHDPTPEFEQAGRAPDPEVKRARPERIDPSDLTAEQRADLEAMSGQSVEHMLQRRNEARASDREAEGQQPPMELRADLPSDDVYNHVIGAYNRGDIPYSDAVRRLEYVDASPVHGQPKPLDTIGDVPERRDDQPDHRGAAENVNDTNEAPAPDGGSGSDDGGSGDGDALAPPPDDPDDGRHGEAAATDAGTKAAEAPRPEDFSMQPPDVAGMYVQVRIDEHGQPDWSTATDPDTGEPIQPERLAKVDADAPESIATDHNHAADNAGNARHPASDEAAVASESALQTPSDQPADARTTGENATPTYDSPTDVRDALLSGKSVPEVRGDIIDQTGDDPVEEETTEIVREQDGYRNEKGTPEELPENFSLDNDEQSVAARLGDRFKDRQFVNDVQEVGDKYVQNVLDAWSSRVKPTGTAVGTPLEHPVYRDSQVDRQQLQGAELMIAPIVLYVLGQHTVRYVGNLITKRKNSQEGGTDDRDH